MQHTYSADKIISLFSNLVFYFLKKKLSPDKILTKYTLVRRRQYSVQHGWTDSSGSIKLEFKLGLGFGKDPSIWPSTINLATAIWAFVRRRCQMAIGGDFLGKLAKG